MITAFDIHDLKDRGVSSSKNRKINSKPVELSSLKEIISQSISKTNYQDQRYGQCY
ncbi:MAG TPA: hypothetical protein VIY08_07835 [Candidatus Nitrosocosmicus sp.]